MPSKDGSTNYTALPAVSPLPTARPGAGAAQQFLPPIAGLPARQGAGDRGRTGAGTARTGERGGFWPAAARRLVSAYCRAPGSGWGVPAARLPLGERGESRGREEGLHTSPPVANGGAVAKGLPCRSGKRGRGGSRCAQNSADSLGKAAGALPTDTAPY